MKCTLVQRTLLSVIDFLPQANGGKTKVTIRPKKDYVAEGALPLMSGMYR